MFDVAEYFDLYDETGRPLGRSKPRDAVHRDGDWHRSAHVWIFTSGGYLLFQRRSARKDTWPGTLDASIGGHYSAGEGTESVVREAREELGLDLALDELIPLGLRRVESHEPGVVDREIQDVYLLRRDLPLTAYHLLEDEIDALVLLDAVDAVRLHAGTIERLRATMLPAGAAEPRTLVLTPSDLPVIPDREPYITAIARSIGDVLSGRTPGRLLLGGM